MESSKRIYFASDFHLGVPSFEESLNREKEVVRWLNQCRRDASEIFLVGDVFDFWFEYRRAVPRGFTRLLGTISDITDSGIPVHWFTGNHDMWIFDYLPSECGITLHRDPVIREWDGKKYMIGHGDGLGPGDRGYKFIKKVFASRLCQWLFARLHPNFGIGLAQLSSGYSRTTSASSDRIFLGEDQEWLVVYAREILKHEHFDGFIFGHRHLPLEIRLNDRSTYFNLGDWIHHYTYGVLDNGRFELRTWDH
ncbi:MAG: UDP-2,3-diacylglucosamine diphosphatase [Flavobacteriales bacterium]